MNTVEIRTQSKSAPGPTGIALAKALVGFRRDPIEMFHKAMTEYGPVVRLKVGPYHLHQIVHPDHIYQVLHSKKYEMSAAFDPSQAIVGQGLATNTSDTWLRQRRMIQPAFHHRHIALFAECILRETAVTIESLRQEARQGRVINISEKLLPLNLRILGQILFSADFSDPSQPLLQSLQTARDYLERSISRLVPVPQSWPTPGNRRFFRDVAVIDAFTYGLIAERRRRPAERIDMLNMFLEARDRTTGEGMNDKELHDELMTVLFAAREDPENAISWGLFLLAQHPEETGRLRAELREVLGDRPPTFDDLQKLSYLNQVIEETLRLYPPAWSLLRDVLEEDEIDGYYIPKESMVLLNIHEAHRLPEFWPEPERFDPERFAPEQAKNRPRQAYLPFGFGPRQCVGRDLGLMVIRFVLALIIQSYELTLAPGYKMERVAHQSLGPKHGVSVLLKEAA